MLFLLYFRIAHCGMCCRDERGGQWWPLGYLLPPPFNRCENGREAGREAVMRDTLQFDLAWYSSLLLVASLMHCSPYE